MSSKTLPPQHQDKQPGREQAMTPQPSFAADWYKGSGKLAGKVAIITGGDSGIGRSVSILFAREGADVAIIYLDEDDDAQQTKKHIEQEGKRCLLLRGDVSSKENCVAFVEQTVKELGGLNIVVNNAAQQFPQTSITDITEAQLTQTFKVNIFGYFFMAQAALPHLSEGDVIINTTSVTAYRGSSHLLDYSATKGAIVSFTRSLSQLLAEKKIRVNGVAPGPIWTPLIPSTFPAEQVQSFGADVPLGRPGQPEEVAPAYVYLAAQDSSYMTGQILHVNGGEVVGG